MIKDSAGDCVFWQTGKERGEMNEEFTTHRKTLNQEEKVLINEMSL